MKIKAFGFLMLTSWLSTTITALTMEELQSARMVGGNKLESLNSTDIRSLLLSEMKDPNVLRVINAVEAAQFFMAKNAHRAYCKYVDEEMIDVLVDGIKSENYQLKQLSLQGLATFAQVTEYAYKIPHKGAIPTLQDLIESKDPLLAGPALDVFAAMITRKMRYRDPFIKNGFIQDLVSIVENPATPPEVLPHVASVFVGLCTESGFPLWESYLNEFLPHLKDFLNSEDEKLASLAAEAFMELLKAQHYEYHFVDEAFIKSVVPLLDDRKNARVNAVKILLTAKEEEVPKWAFDSGIMGYMNALIHSKNAELRKDALKLLEKIIIDSNENDKVQKVFQEEVFLPFMHQLFTALTNAAATTEFEDESSFTINYNGVACSLCKLSGKASTNNAENGGSGTEKAEIQEMLEKLPYKKFDKQLEECGCLFKNEKTKNSPNKDAVNRDEL